MITLLLRAARLVWAIAFLAICSSGAFAERRVALVIGNAKYQHADTLANTLNDANAMAALFKRAGFDVVDLRRDIGVVEFKRAVREFLSASANADIAVVYYSGHGMEVGGVNYLIPVDAKLASAFDVDDETVPLDRIILATQSAKKLSLIILDACRENPFLRAEGSLPVTRSLASRLISVEPNSADTLIAYAAKAGSLSYDGAGPNSPFTTALVKYIAEPGLDIRIALGKVRDDVLAATGNRQEPFVYGSLGGGDVSLVPAAAAQSPAASLAPTDQNAAVAADYERAERVGSPEGWRAFLGIHPSGYYAELARAQLGKLRPAAPILSAAKEAAPSPAPANPPSQENTPPAVKSQQEAALAPGVAATAETPSQICARDEASFAKLRKDPSPEKLARFARELGCENLRQQVKRFIESLAPPTANLPSETPAPPASAQPPIDQAQACKRDQGRLARLRADPSPDQATQFWRELACEDLRPQLKRLLESMGVATVSPAPPSAPAPGTASAPSQRPPPPSSEPSGQPPATESAVRPADGSEPCKREADELARIRANPDRASARRFAHDLKCDALRAQAARLLESLGD
jgi:Caspase domain